MKLQDITKMDKDDVLTMLGLEARRSGTGRAVTTMGIFGVGLLVGAGVALLLAPKTGRQLREDLTPKFRRDGKRETVAAHANEGPSANGATSAPL